MLNNWVKESVDSAPGTGTIDLGGAETGYIGFADAYQSGQVVHYTIEDGNNRESGIGTFTDAATDTLSRDTILETLVSGTYDNTSPSAITLTSAAIVSISANANTVLTGPLGLSPGTYGLSQFGHASATLTQSTLDSNVVYAVPFKIENKVLVSKIGIELTATAGTKIRCGIYDSANGGMPDNLLATTSDITPSAAVIDTSLTASIILNPGLYWVSIIQDGANTWEMWNRTYSISLGGPLFGTKSLAHMWSVSAASWSALPDPFGTATGVSNKNVPILRLL